MIPQAQQPRNNRALAHYYFPANHTNHANKIWTAGTRHRSQHLDSSRCRGKAQTSGQLLPANHTKNTNKHPVHSCASCHSRALIPRPHPFLSSVFSLPSAPCRLSPASLPRNNYADSILSSHFHTGSREMAKSSVFSCPSSSHVRIVPCEWFSSMPAERRDWISRWRVFGSERS